MKLHCDLHAHSAFAGGARAGGSSKKEKEKRIKKRFVESAIYSPLKGVNILGTGDIQFEPWREFIEKNFDEDVPGIYSYRGTRNIPEDKIIPDNHEYEIPKYLLQSEYILTGPIKSSDYKKRVHIIVLFPNFTAIDELIELFDKWEVSYENMARPFLVSETTEEVNDKINAIADIHPMIEIIPAHVMTPEGVYGGNERVNRMEDFFGSSATRFHAVETGLSADPTILGLIPELDDLTLLSNADAHSSKLNRVGREFTSLDIQKMSYNHIIEGIRSNNVVKTAEFHPTEGRYFLTGHREGRTRPGNHDKNQYCFFSPEFVPDNDICPQCNEELTIGVLQRAYEISEAQGKDRMIGDGPQRNFVTMVPLVEIIAHAIGMKTLTAKTVLRKYAKLMRYTKSEVNLWIDDESISKLRDTDIDERIVDEIELVKEGNFCFYPGGYDGVYGDLRIGETMDFEKISVINN